MTSNKCLRDEMLAMAKERHSTSFSPPSSSHMSIYQIPKTLRLVKPKAYNPRVVSIGLIYRSATEKIRNMDATKEVYMSSLFHRTIDPFETTQNELIFEETVRLCVDSMTKLADAARKSYHVSYHCFVPEITARIMLLDGCFIIELLLRCCSAQISDVDSITGNWSKLNSIKEDLLMLENQIPFFVLEELYRHTVERFPQNHQTNIPPLKELILEFFGNNLNSNFKLKIKSDSRGENVEVNHILGFLHSCYMPDTHRSYYGNLMIRRYSAAEIFTSGINLKPSQKRNTYLDVSFKTPCLFSWFPNITSVFLFPWWLAIFIYSTIFSKFTHTASTELPLSMPTRKGQAASASCCWLSFMCQFFCRAVLEIFELHITESTESFLRNMIAYEQLCPGIPRYFTSYAFLMDMIINTEDHVEILETSGVLKNYFESSDNTTSALFNSLCNEISLGNGFYFLEPWKQVDAYCNLKWPSFLGSLRVTYFSNPWTGISVFAALLLFAFTGVQTAGTVLQTWY